MRHVARTCSDTDRIQTLDEVAEAAIATRWDLGAPQWSVHDRGMNSRTWLVVDGGRRWVAKAVPQDARDRFVAGLEVAAIVDRAGIPSGAPEPTSDGSLSVQVEGGALALLRFVKGEPLVGKAATEQRLIGSTLAMAHRTLRDVEVSGAQRFHWLEPGAPHLDVEPWVRPAVRGAIDVYDRLQPEALSWGQLHSDPAPEAFLLDARTGTCGLIDWDTGLFGPLMYDVASAVMYVGGPGHASVLLDAYVGEGVLTQDEVDNALEPMLRIRWAIQADYFAGRIVRNDLTGIAGPDENQAGLDDARRALGR